MSFIKNIDITPLILFSSLVVLWFFIPNKLGLFGIQHDFANSNFPFENALYIESSEDSVSISLMDDKFEPYYSVNGGKDFYPLNSRRLSISNLKNSQIEFRPTSIRWRHPAGGLPSFSNLVIVAVNADNREISTKRVVNFPASYESKLAAICITIDEDDLFSWNEGVMTYGKSSEVDDGFYKEWWYRKGNFSERGKEWKKKVNFQYFENNQLLIDQDCGMKVSGNATRYFAQKSLKLYADKDYGKKSFKYKFWGDEGIKKSKSILLRNSGNDNDRTMFADLLLQRLAKNANVLTQEGKPVNVFLNGRYWGVYNLRERIDDNFVAQKEGCDKSDVTILYCEVYGDRSILRVGKESDKKEFDDLISSIPLGQKISQTKYDEIESLVDLSSFIDYMIFETYYANNDWLYNNTTWYKVKGDKWRWILNDLDVTLAYPGEQNIELNMFDKLKTTDSYMSRLFSALIDYPVFNSRFKNRVKALFEADLSENVISTQFVTTKKQLEGDILNQIGCWRSISSIEDWESNCEKNLEFLLDRKTVYLNQIEDLK